MEELLKDRELTEFELEQYKNIAYSVYNLKNYRIALKFFEFYHKYSKDTNALPFIASCYDIVGDKLQALNYYKKVIDKDDKVYINLSRLYYDVYKFSKSEEQVKYAEIANKLNPYDEVILINLLLVYCRFNIVDRCKLVFEEINKRGIKLSPAVLFSYGCFLIRNKEFKDGFALYRYRIEYDSQSLPGGLKNLWQPNIDLSDKTILITYEQGFGDTLMFIRFVERLECKKKFILVQNELYDLLKYNYSNVIKYDELKNLEYDYFVPLMDIPLLINLIPETIDQKDGYIKVHNKYNSKINKNNKFKIGICYEGSVDGLDTCRDIPLEKLSPLFKLPVEIYSFQKEDRNNQLSKFPNIIKLGYTFNTFEDTASAMKEMDLIVTIDCGILNLAGSLGVKTFALFNEYPEFRWFNLENDIGWYNIKPFQCEKFNEWEQPVNKMVQDIKKLIKK